MMLFLLAAGWLLTYANRTVLYPLLSIIAADFSLSSADVGLLTSSYFFTYLLLQVPAGILGDRIGMRRVLLWTYAVAAAGRLGSDWSSAITRDALLHGAAWAGGRWLLSISFGMMMQKVRPQQRAFSSALIGIGMALVCCGDDGQWLVV